MIRDMSITHIDFEKITPETLFEFVELFSFTRRCRSRRVDFEGECPIIIVPYYHLDKLVYIIDKEIFDKIKERYMESIGKKEE